MTVRRILVAISAVVALVVALVVLSGRSSLPSAAPASSGVTSSASTSATGSSSPSTPRSPSTPSPRYYLSLGDSLAFGFQPDVLRQSSFTPADFPGYTEDFARSHPELTVVNYGCPGETSASMLGRGRIGRCFYPGALHDSWGDAADQAAAASAFLAAHPGQVALISIDIGSNDLLQVTGTCSRRADPTSCMTRALPKTLRTLKTNYRDLLTTITGLAPDARVVLFTYYNPLATTLPGSDALAIRASSVVRRLATRFDASVADAFGAINGAAGTPAERSSLCTRTWACSSYHDVHPTDRGYRALAAALARAAGMG